MQHHNILTHFKSFFLAGGIVKSKRPVSQTQKELNKQARMAISTGELDKDELKRKSERDLRTLYVRFGNNAGPKNISEIYKLDKTIKIARVPRQGKAKAEKCIKYCFVEFSDEAACELSKDKLASNPNHYVDFVGVKSKGQKGNTGNLKKTPINPTRLMVSGLTDAISEDQLRKLFPKCVKAEIPKKVAAKEGRYGFVQFRDPADAKSAFDAANKLKIDSEEGATHLSVLYARVSKPGEQLLSPDKKKDKKSKKANKRKNPEETQEEDLTKKKKSEDEGDEVEDPNDPGIVFLADDTKEEKVAPDEKKVGDQENDKVEAEKEVSDKEDENFENDKDDSEDEEDENLENDKDDSEDDDDGDDDDEENSGEDNDDNGDDPE